MAKNIQVTKIVASSTPQAWAQAYHAGNLTAIVTVTPKTKEDATSLHIVGKDLLNTFESEYFTLENKHLASIKQAVETTYKKSAATHTISFLVAAAIQNTLYVVLAGNGSIFLLRNGKIGTLLSQETKEPTIQSSSGFLEHGDMIVLTSPSFLQLIDKEKIFAALTENTLADAGEILTPPIHAAAQGDAAAICMSYEDDTASPRPHELGITPSPVKNEKQEETVEDKHPTKAEENIQEEQQIELKKEEPIFSQPLGEHEDTAIPAKKKLSHQRKLLLSIIIILVVVLGLTSYFAISKQQEAKNAALFHSVYPQAEQKYQEASGLLDLNPSLAHDDLTSAQQQLDPIKSKLIAGSSEQKQVSDLLAKIQTALDTETSANTVSATKVDTSTNALLAYAAANTSISYLTDDATNIYSADATTITQISKKSQTTKKLFTNNKTWQSLGGFETYLGNFYLLDTAAGIVKFVPSGNTLIKSNYFTSGVTPDLSHAISIAIDGSIWVLGTDGSILKFTKGKQDTFAISGLDKPLISPTRIITNVDMDNVYILDTGNGRMVALDKTGKFIKSYASTLLKKATQLVVDEKNKIALFLSSGSVYQISLQ